MGRFTSPDEFTGGPTELFADVAAHNPTFYADIYNPQSLNKYQYALNNPLKFVDPDGHQETLADALNQASNGTMTIPVVGPLVKLAAVIVAAFPALADANAPTARSSGCPAIADCGYTQAEMDAMAKPARSQDNSGEQSSLSDQEHSNSTSDGPYSHLPDGKNVGPGKKFTPSQRKKVYAENKKQNNGIVRDDETGEELTPSQQSKKGVPTPPNAAQIDHHIPRSKDGSNSFKNARVAGARRNQQKSNKMPNQQ